MTLNVHIVNKYNTVLLEELRAQVRDDILVTSGSATEIDGSTPDDFDILVGGFLNPEILERSGRLRAVIVPFAGVPAPTRDLLARYPQIALHNLHYNVIPTAETALALLLAAAKLIVPIDRELRAGDWRSRYTSTPVVQLSGKRALILGYGQIGRHLAPILLAMGMSVEGIRRDPPAHDDDERVPVYPPGALTGRLAHADVLIGILPLTPETEGVIGAAQLALLPRDAILINVGRGATIDEAALYQALADGKLLAAGIDVWYNYPETEADRVETLPSQFPFHELDNVVMSPHRAGFLSAAEPERMRQLAQMLNAAAAGEEMGSLVNKELGY